MSIKRYRTKPSISTRAKVKPSLFTSAPAPAPYNVKVALSLTSIGKILSFVVIEPILVFLLMVRSPGLNSARFMAIILALSIQHLE
ncbi:MAG: hypothetical protein RCG15_05130 [Candidatus Rickettsia vulgarisii]